MSDRKAASYSFEKERVRKGEERGSRSSLLSLSLSDSFHRLHLFLLDLLGRWLILKQKDISL